MEFFEPAECGKCFVCALVGVFREVRRVLRDDGTVWLNLGDSYAGGGRGGGIPGSLEGGSATQVASGLGPRPLAGMKPKDLLGIPWMVAFALRADGWYLRSDIIWAKPNPMPESVTDRPTKAHEYLFLLSKGPRYFYDADAIREGASENTHARRADGQRSNGQITRAAMVPGKTIENQAGLGANGDPGAGRNKRSVWTVATQPYPGAHFATFPPKLIEPCILAGCPEWACGECGAPWRRVVEREDAPAAPKRPKDYHAAVHTGGVASSRLSISTGAPVPTSRTVGWEPSCDHDAPTVPGTVLDPFAGSGATGVVATWHRRSFVGVELSAKYAEMAKIRVAIEGEGSRSSSPRPKRAPEGQNTLFGA